MKLTKKQLIELAHKLDARKVGKQNIYDYENQIYYIIHKMSDKINNLDIYNYVENTKENIYNTCIAYSVGLYGNIARIDKLETENNEIMFVYYGD